MFSCCKGQAIAFDIAVIFIAIAIFAAAVWTVSVDMKAPASQAQRSRSDFTKSLLLQTLYTTPETSDARYHYKSIGDLLSIYMMSYPKRWRQNELKVTEWLSFTWEENGDTTDEEKKAMDEVIIKRLREAKISDYIRARSGGLDLDWIIYTKYDDSFLGTGYGSASLGSLDTVEVCFHGKGDLIERCPKKQIGADRSSGASARIVHSYNMRPIDVYLGIVWE